MTVILKEYSKMEDQYDIPPGQQEVIQMLVNGVVKKIEDALEADANGELTVKGFYLGRATGIIDALRNMLDTVNGGQTATDLDTIYNHVDLCLQAATEPANDAYLHEALEIMENIAIGCSAIPLEVQKTGTDVLHA